MGCVFFFQKSSYCCYNTEQIVLPYGQHKTCMRKYTHGLQSKPSFQHSCDFEHLGLSMSISGFLYWKRTANRRLICEDLCPGNFRKVAVQLGPTLQMVTKMKKRRDSALPLYASLHTTKKLPSESHPNTPQVHIHCSYAAGKMLT